MEGSDAEELAYMFMKMIVANYGLPDEIINDRDVKFTLNF